MRIGREAVCTRASSLDDIPTNRGGVGSLAEVKRRGSKRSPLGGDQGGGRLDGILGRNVSLDPSKIFLLSVV